MSPSQRRSARRRRTTAAAATAGEPRPVVDDADDVTTPKARSRSRSSRKRTRDDDETDGAAAKNPAGAAADPDPDLGDAAVTPETRRSEAYLQRRRAREARARAEKIAQFAALAALLRRIERADDPAAGAGAEGVAATAGEPLSRTELIARTIRVLEGLYAQNRRARKEGWKGMMDRDEPDEIVGRTIEGDPAARKCNEAEAAETLAALGATHAADAPPEKDTAMTTPERKETAEDLTRWRDELGAAKKAATKLQKMVDDLARKHAQAEAAALKAEVASRQVVLNAARAAAARKQDKVEELARKHDQAVAAAQQATVCAAPMREAATPKQRKVEKLARKREKAVAAPRRPRAEASARPAASSAAHEAESSEQDKAATKKPTIPTPDKVSPVHGTNVHEMQMPLPVMPPHVSTVATFVSQVQQPSNTAADPAPPAAEALPVVCWPPAAPAPGPASQAPSAPPITGASVSSQPKPAESTKTVPAPKDPSAPPTAAAPEQPPVMPPGFSAMMPPIGQSVPCLPMATNTTTPSNVIPNPFMEPSLFDAAAAAAVCAASSTTTPSGKPQQSMTSSSPPASPVPYQPLQFLSQLYPSQLASAGTSALPASGAEEEKPQEGQDPSRPDVGVSSVRDRGSAAKRSHAEMWNDRFEELRLHQLEFGTCRVPFKHDRGLCNWVDGQRRKFYNKPRKGEKAMSEQNRQKLESIGFEASPRVEGEKPWEGQDPSPRPPSRPEQQEGDGSIQPPADTLVSSPLCSDAEEEEKEDPTAEAVPEKCEDRPEDFRGSALNDGVGVSSARDRCGEAKRSHAEMWNDRFEALHLYQLEFGTCRVPAGHDRGLHNWVHAQRRRFYNKPRKGEKAMSEQNREKLESIGFGFEASRVEEAKPQEGLDPSPRPLLRQEPQEGAGSIQAPAATLVSSPLCSYAEEDFKEDPTGEAAPEKCEDRPEGVSRSALDDVVVTFSARDGGGEVKRMSLSHDQMWNNKYEALQSYQQEYGNCRVPAGHDKLLCSWVHTQRRYFYSKLRKGEKAMTEQRRLKLESIGFEASPEECEERLEKARRSALNDVVVVFSARDGGDEATRMSHDEVWNNKYEALRFYQLEHGNCRVPSKHYKLLSSFVYTQRRLFHNKPRKGEKAMTEERRLKLESIGFEAPEKCEEQREKARRLALDDHAGASYHDDMWNNKFEALRIYTQEHGTCRVPAKHEGVRGLCNWVHAQRRRFHNKPRKGEKAMSEQDRQKLESIGFE